MQLSFTRKQEIEPETYSLYLQALYFLKAGQNESLKRSLEMFQRVTDLNPNYPPAWVGIADACWNLISHDEIDKPTGLELAENACKRALELDVNYAESAAFQIAEIYGVHRDLDKVFHWLNFAIDVKDNGITEMFTSPFLREAREDTRWANLVQRRGL